MSPSFTPAVNYGAPPQASSNPYQDQLQLVPATLIGPVDRNQNSSDFHPMVRSNWGIVDHIRGVLGASFVEYAGPTGTRTLYNASVTISNLQGSYGSYGPVANEFGGDNDGTNIVFDYSLTPGAQRGDPDVMTLTFSDAGWKSYEDITAAHADWFSHDDVDGDQDNEVMATETALIRARLNSYVGTSPYGSPVRSPGLLNAATGSFFDHTTLLYLPSPNAAIRTRSSTRFNIEPIYSYERRSWSLEQTIAPDAVAEHILPNAYYLQFELENTGSTFLAGGRYKQALSLNDQAVPNGPNGEDRRWFWTLPAVFPGAFAAQIRRTTGIENNIGRFYETYSQALAAADNDNLLPNLAETIHKNLMVLYRDRDTLTEDVINPEATPFYNKITIPTELIDSLSSALTTASYWPDEGSDFLSMLQYLAVMDLAEPSSLSTTDFRVGTKTITSAGYFPGSVHTVSEASYTNLSRVNNFLSEPTQPIFALMSAQSIESDTGPASSISILHRHGLDNTPLTTSVNEDVTNALDDFNNAASNYRRNFQQVLDNHPCTTETLMYVVKKYKDESDTLLQTFYFTNRFDGQDIIFYDSQIKPKQRYRYTFERVMFIIGNEYSYSFPSAATDIDFIRNPTFPGSYNARLNITNLPNIKACLVPYVAGDIVTIVEDKPPVPPDMSFHPFHGANNQIKILLNASVGITSEKPIAILEEDKSFFVDECLAQTGLTTPYDDIETIEFRSDDPVDAYTLFRTTTKPSSYRDFESGARRSLNPERGIPGALTDTIRPNTIYYYCARAVDINGNVSNPTHIFEIELVDNAGQIFLRREVIQFESTQVEYTKTGQRYIYIEPSMLQLTMLDDTDAHIGTPSTISQPHDTILGASGIDTVWQKTFKIRTTSKKTGKKLDLNLTFKNTGIVNPSE